MITEHDRQRHSQPQITEAQLDAAADKYGSYDEAFRRLDITPEDVIYDTPAEIGPVLEKTRPPIAVSLADRALALADIMAFYSKDNQTKGSKTQVNIPDSDFSTRHEGRTSEVQEGAEENRAVLLRKFHAALHVLNATEAMQAYQRKDGDPEIYPDGMGYIDESDIELSRVALQRNLREEFAGTGDDNVAKRNKLVRRAAAAAKNVSRP